MPYEDEPEDLDFSPPDAIEDDPTPPIGALETRLLNPPHTDCGNGERLAVYFGHKLRYCAKLKSWLIWNGKCWLPDGAGQIERLAVQAMRKFGQVSMHLSPEVAQACRKWAIASEDSRRIHAMINHAKTVDPLPIDLSDLDTHHFILNFQNGMADLITGELIPHDPKRFITKVLPFKFDPTCPIPVFRQFLIDSFLGKGEHPKEDLERAERMISYLQLAFGYSLTGSTAAKLLFVCHGPKNSGKSTLLTLFHSLLQPAYSAKISIMSLLRAHAKSNAARADLADLCGARFAMTSETERGCKLDEGLIKNLTKGMGSIKTDRKGQNPIEFPETHKIWIDANHKPELDSEDDAIWVRFHIIPFLHSLNSNQMDRRLSSKLLREAPGILAWGVQGAKLWYEAGMELQRPPEFEAAVEEWKTESDYIGQFLSECCERGEDFWIPRAVLQSSFFEWKERQGEGFSITPEMLKSRLTAEGIKDATKRVGNSVPHVYLGVRLLGMEEPSEN